VAYLLKLQIEMKMAELITKITHLDQCFSHDKYGPIRLLDTGPVRPGSPE
jgi:hypothetical protein